MLIIWPLELEYCRTIGFFYYILWMLSKGLLPMSVLCLDLVKQWGKGPTLKEQNEISSLTKCSNIAVTAKQFRRK